jgi:hypothetical protein
MKVEIEIEGGEELLKALERSYVNADKALDEATLAGGEVVRREANRLAPSPDVEVEVEREGERAVAKIGPHKDKWYLRFFELGATSHEITGLPLAFEGRAGLVITGRVDHPGMAARPFLRPAIDSKQDAARDAVGVVLKRAVER